MLLVLPAPSCFLLVLLASTLPAGILCSAPSPPPLPLSFSIQFNETFSGFPAPPSSGAWAYDFPNSLWRADHFAPQSNNFCACSDNTTTGSCALLFVPSGPTGAPSPIDKGGMFVDFIDAPHECCWMCGSDEGCTPLIPTWLSNNTYTNFGIDDLGCNEFCVPGASAAEDCLSYPIGTAVPQPNVPCKYSETFTFGTTTILHNLTFRRDTFVPGPPPSSVFKIRDECGKPCRNLFPAQCG